MVEDQLRQVAEMAKKIALTTPPFDLQIEGNGVFQGRSSAALWFATKDKGALLSVSRSIDKETIDLGFTPNKGDFRPHLTIARLKGQKSSEPIEAHLHKEFDPVEFTVYELVIYESRLLATGPLYTKAASIPLMGSN